MKSWYFTSESVTEGHPDKICDQISDGILDAILEKDKNARVACEVMASTGVIIITGEITTDVYVDFTEIARDVVRKIGYTKEEYDFDADSFAVLSAVKGQSPDIALGVNRITEEEFDSVGAGDQGIMFGYATNETSAYMPLPIYLAHKLSKRLADVRKDGTIPYLRPDGKTQVTVEYNDGVAVGIKNIVVSTQHDEDVSLEQIRGDIIKHVILPIVPEELSHDDIEYYINPTGRFVIGGPVADVGLTGRKIIVDTYGGFARHGGGAFSGKDPTKVDRSATYYARYIAKNLVAAGLADRCEIGLAYAIGVARPTSVYVETFGTGKISDNEIEEIVNRHFDMRPAAIIKNLDLIRPIYRDVAAYGHFGREDLNLPWEELDKVEELKKYVGQA